MLALNKIPKLFGKIGFYKDPLGDFTYTYKKDETRLMREKIFQQLENSKGLVTVTMVCGEFKKFQIDLLYSLLQKKSDLCKLKVIGGPCYFPEKDNLNNPEEAQKEFLSSKIKMKEIVKNKNSSIYIAEKRKIYHFILFEGLETPDGKITKKLYKENPHGPTDRSLDTILVEGPYPFVRDDILNNFNKSLFKTNKITKEEDVDSIILYDPKLEICE